MAIKSSGSLTFTEIEAEWDNSSPFSLSEFYSGGSTVYAGAADGDGNAIPSSGTISFSNFYDTTAFSNTTTASPDNAPGNNEVNNRNGQQATSTVTVPAGANAIYITNTSAGGGGGLRGQEHKNVGEQPGDGGGGGAGITSAYFTVVAGETLTINVGHGGNDNHVSWSYPGVSGDAPYTQLTNVTDGTGGTTSLSGSSTGNIFTLTGGTVGTSPNNGGAFKSLMQDNPGTGGTVTFHTTPLSSGTTTAGDSVSSASSSNGSDGADGPAVGENQRGAGGAGGNSGLGSGSGAGAPASGALLNGSDGANGGGGGGGTAQNTPAITAITSSDGEFNTGGTGNGLSGSSLGGLGGHGKIQYQFVRVV